jgi:hypothetical protein
LRSDAACVRRAVTTYPFCSVPPAAAAIKKGKIRARHGDAAIPKYQLVAVPQN